MSLRIGGHVQALIGLALAAAIIVGGWLVRPHTGEGGPRVIRIGAPAVAGSQQVYYGAMGLARAKGWIDREFARDGIRVEFVGFSSAAMVAQALANEQIDFAAQGDMISLISKAGGTDTRVILPSGRFSNAYLAVPAGSPIQSVADLRGRRVGYTKGNYVQLQALRILAAHGMTEQDIRAVNLSAHAAAAALAAGQIDAVFQGPDILLLREKGLARIVFDTRDKPEFTGQSSILVRSAFAQAHGDIVYRLVRVLVGASRYGSDEAHRTEALRIWSTGRPIGPLTEDYRGRPMREHLNPLLDPYIQARYERTQRDTDRLGLLRAPPVDVGAWFDRRYLDQALRQLGLRDFWTARDADGRPIGAPR